MEDPHWERTYNPLPEPFHYFGWRKILAAPNRAIEVKWDVVRKLSADWCGW